ncbi:MAG: ornithine carbamoyltransferase [bacterium]
MALSKKDFLSIISLPQAELRQILDLAKEQKPLARKHELPPSHPGRVLACVFAKPSLRTRVSFEVAIRQLGGSSLYITDQEIGMGKRESVHDIAKVLSRFVDGIMIRTFAQQDVEDLARHASVPVINGLTDLLHPCQVMGDILTVEEHLGSIESKTVVMIGDGNNLANSWLNAAIRFPFNFILACPKGYEPDEAIMNQADAAGASFMICNDPQEAVDGAHVIYGDVWTSMGQEAETAKRLKDFEGFQINEKLLAGADADHIVLHCLPAHRGEEITDGVMDGKHSAVFDQAENRLHAQRAIIALLME